MRGVELLENCIAKTKVGVLNSKNYNHPYDTFRKKLTKTLRGAKIKALNHDRVAPFGKKLTKTLRGVNFASQNPRSVAFNFLKNPNLQSKTLTFAGHHLARVSKSLRLTYSKSRFDRIPALFGENLGRFGRALGPLSKFHYAANP